MRCPFVPNMLALLLFCGIAAACADAVQPPMDIEVGVNNTQPDTLSHDQLNYLTGKFELDTHPDFVRIDPAHASSDNMYMRRDAYEAFVAMYEAALQGGIRLRIVSAGRNFERQKQIWEAKWSGNTLVEEGVNLAQAEPNPKQRALRILRFSSMPGTSRHHWGTDIDLNHLENNWFEHGEGARIYAWLTAHAPGYGYCQPYTAKGEHRPHGYEEEKWHWTYMPVSQPLTDMAARHLRDEDLRGFLGDETAPLIGVVERYVLGIDPVCRQKAASED